MLLPPPNRRRFAGHAGISVALHAAFLALVMGVVHRPLRVFNLPGTASGSHIDVVYLPGSAPAPAPSAKTKAVRPPAVAALPQRRALLPPIEPPAPPPPQPQPAVASPAPDPDPPPTPAAGALAGSDSFGAGDVQIAFTTYSPSPQPDLSRLPSGAQGDVVLDVTIDSKGKIADLEVLRSLGYGIESSVVSTVRTWTFRPATKDGVPIASVQELHFHYGPV
jgi:protein TonB